MKIDHSKLQLSAKDQLTVRLMRGLRALAGVAIVGAIYLAMVISMVPDLFDRPVASVSATVPSHLPEHQESPPHHSRDAN